MPVPRSPWKQIARVLVPGEHEFGDTVALLLHDGRTVPVTSLRKHQPSDFGTGISPWYSEQERSCSRRTSTGWAPGRCHDPSATQR